jgi:signal transduction histidine kinase/CheY-like chemotaxis protein
VNIVQQPSGTATQEVRIEKNGEYSWYEIGSSLIHDSVGNLMGQVLLVRDVSDRVKVTQEKKEMEIKAHVASRLATVGQMAAGICHEINNPLTAVMGYSDMLATQDLPEDTKQELEYIHEGSRRIANIVRQLLAFSRETKPEKTMVDINGIMENTLKLREYELRIANIKVLTELAHDLPYTLADAGQLQQVFINIVLNAEAEMKLAHGQGTLLVKTEYVDDTIRILFKDDGPGILKENIDRIFEPFFTTRKVGEGTGLGLSVCHGIIKEHNGRIYVRSERGKGATFIVELPISTKSKRPEMPSTAPQETTQIYTRKGSILIIDDEPSVLQFLEQYLTTEGHYVDAVDNANDALRAFNNKRHDLILMDILMPDIGGIELYKKFERMDKSVGDRVLIMTGDILGKPTKAFLSKTSAPYIEKPFDVDALMTKIDEIMSQNR